MIFTKSRIKMISDIAAPYLAVLLFWCFIHNAWLAILAYHAHILFWSRHSLRPKKPGFDHTLLLALPAVLAGPLLYILLPYMTRTDLSAWLHSYGLSGISLICMIPYFGIIHPYLEQIHWSRLRKETHLSHFLFAGYHMLVLSTLLTIPWLIACFAILTAASFAWNYIEHKSSSLTPAVISHILADLGIMLTAYLSV